MMSGADKKFPVVTVQKAERTDLRSLVTATGKTEAQRKVDLSANVMGQIVNLAVREVTRSRRATSCCRSTSPSAGRPPSAPRVPQGALFRPRRRTRPGRGGKKSFERAERSFKDQIIPQADVDRARAAFEGADANWKAVERRIAQSRANLAGAHDKLSKTKCCRDRRRHHRPAGRGGQGRDHRFDEQPRHQLMTISDMGTVEGVI